MGPVPGDVSDIPDDAHEVERSATSVASEDVGELRPSSARRSSIPPTHAIYRASRALRWQTAPKCTQPARSARLVFGLAVSPRLLLGIVRGIDDVGRHLREGVRGHRRDRGIHGDDLPVKASGRVAQGRGTRSAPAAGPGTGAARVCLDRAAAPAGPAGAGTARWRSLGTTTIAIASRSPSSAVTSALGNDVLVCACSVRAPDGATDRFPPER